jgi:hypothetical protein
MQPQDFYLRKMIATAVLKKGRSIPVIFFLLMFITAKGQLSLPPAYTISTDTDRYCRVQPAAGYQLAGNGRSRSTLCMQTCLQGSGMVNGIITQQVRAEAIQSSSLIAFHMSMAGLPPFSI